MTDRPDPPNPPPRDGSVASDPAGGVDFAALVAEHNVSRLSGSSAGGVDVSGGTADAPTGGRLRRWFESAGGSSRWWRVGYPAVVGAVLVVLIPALVFVGLRVILDSTDGQLVKRVTDPAAPGYEAVVTKTPTALVATVGPDNTLVGVALLALTSDSSGGVLTMPPSLTYTTPYGAFPVWYAWSVGGIDELAYAVGSVVDLSFSEKITVQSSDWTALLSTAGTISVTIPDQVRDAKDAVVFNKGTVQVKPDQAWSFLSSMGPKDNELNRALRQELFWKAWIGQLRSSGAQFPGPTTSGLGRFISALGHGQVSVSSLPVSALPPLPPLPQRYAAVGEPAQAAVAAIVPFPDGAPGQRPRMRVLDGTGRLGNGITAAIQVNAAGGQVDVVGNAKSYGQATTEIIYFEGTTEQTARRMRDALDVGELVASKESNSAADITVVLGEDYLAKYGPTS